jgi:HlyD family secretion protein
MRILLALLVLVVLGITGANYLLTDPTANAQYRLAKVEYSDITEVVAVTGHAEPERVSVVESQVMGIVTEVLKDYNDPVKEGESLVRLSSDIERVQFSKAEYELEAAKSGQQVAEATIRGAEAGVKAAESALAAAQRELRDAEALFAKKDPLIPQQKVDVQRDLCDKAKALLEQAKTQVEQAKIGKMQAETKTKAAQLAVDAARLSLNLTDLKANMTGFVLRKNVRVGDMVGRPRMSLTDNVGGLFVLASPLDNMKAIVKVSEADYGRVKIGQKATFTIDAYPDEVFEARVVLLRNATSSDRTAVSYETELEFTNHKDPKTGEWMVKPDATISADIEIRHEKHVLTAPNLALAFQPDDFDIVVPDTKPGEAVVWVLGPDNRPAARVVKRGIANNERTQISGSGLKEGDEVIVEQRETKTTKLKLPIGS